MFTCHSLHRYYYNKDNIDQLYHLPAYSLIEFDDNSFTCQYHELKSAKPHTAVFKADSILKQLEQNEELGVKLAEINKSFMDNLGTSKEEAFSLTSTEDIIAKQPIPEEIRDTLNFYLEQ